MEGRQDLRDVLDCFYSILSGNAGQARDWEAFLSLFTKDARMYPHSSVHSPSSPYYGKGVDVHAYIDQIQDFLLKNDFFETGRIVQAFSSGNIANVISTYEARHNKNDAQPYKAGANFIHLLYQPDGWRIVSMIWQDNSTFNIEL